MRIPKLRLHVSGWHCVRIQGKDHYLSRDKREAKSLYRDLLAQRLGVATPSQDKGITVAELLSRHATAQLANCQPRWRSNRRGILHQCHKHALGLYGNLPAVSFGPLCFQKVRQSMAEEPGRCREYVNSLASKLKGAWKWGVAWELVPLATYQALALVPELQPGELGLPEGEEREAVEAELVLKCLPFLTDKNADLVRLLLLTGARPDELVRLKVSDIEKHKDGTWTHTPRQHKTAKANRKRQIVFNAEARAILGKYLLKGRTYLFPANPAMTAVGTEPHYRVGSLCHAVKRACVRGRLEVFTPYQIRHRKATDVALEHGLDVAAALLGHSSKAQTAVYDHGQLTRAKKAVG